MRIANALTLRLRMIASRHPVCGILLAAMALPLAGCGGARYDERMEESGDRLMHTKPFQEHLYREATSLEETGVSIQVPKLFDKSKMVKFGKLDSNQEVMGADRIQPPFLKLPGYLFGYEKYEPLGKGKKNLPTYIYFAVVEDEEWDIKRLKGNLTDQIRSFYQSPPKSGFSPSPGLEGGDLTVEAIPEGGEDADSAAPAEPTTEPEPVSEDKLKWEAVELITPEAGKKIEWDSISMTGNQLFYADTGMYFTFEGRMDLYIHSPEDIPIHVIVGFRAPTDRLEESGLFETVEATLGSVVVEPREEEDGEPASATDE